MRRSQLKLSNRSLLALVLVVAALSLLITGCSSPGNTTQESTGGKVGDGLSQASMSEPTIEITSGKEGDGLSQTSTSEPTIEITSAASGEVDPYAKGEPMAYHLFADLSEEEQLDIQHWMNGYNSATFVCYDKETDRYFISLTPNAYGMYPTGFVYSMDGDTLAIKKIAEAGAASLQCHDGWLYYSDASEYNVLYRMRFDGSQKERVSDKQVAEYAFVGDYIYFAERFTPKHGIEAGVVNIHWHKFMQLSRMKMDGSGYQKVDDIMPGTLRYIPPYLYVAEIDWNTSLFAVWKYSLDGQTEPTLLQKRGMTVGDLGDVYPIELFTGDGRQLVSSAHIGVTSSDPKNWEQPYPVLINSSGAIETFWKPQGKFVPAQDFYLINGELYYAYFERDDARFGIAKIDGPRHNTAISELYHQPFRAAASGDYIFILNEKGVSILSPDGKIERVLVEPMPVVNEDTIGLFLEKRKEIQEVMDYFKEIGIFDGETVDFTAIPELGYKISHIMLFGRRVTSASQDVNLLEINEEEILKLPTTLGHIEGIRRRLLHLKEIVDRNL